MGEHSLIEQMLDLDVQYDLLPAGQRVVAGVSGGVDSLVMLHMLKYIQQEKSLDIVVATLDHGLRGDAGQADAEFVKQIADTWGLSFYRAYADVNALVENFQMNLEEAARLARYTFLLYVAAAVDAPRIAVAHNSDDQAETVLMHIIRGSGLRGLRGMLPLVSTGDYYLLEDAEEFITGLPELETPPDPEDFELIRPILNCCRVDIRDYAGQYALQPREDETNNDLHRFRNRIRHEILPHMENLNPHVKDALIRLADVAQGDVAILESRLEAVAAWLLDWHETMPDENGEPGIIVYIDREAFRQQPLGLQRGLVRKVIDELVESMRNISYEQTEKVRLLILNGQTNMQFELPEGLTLTIGYDEAHIGYGGDPRYPAHLPGLEEGQYIELDPEGQGYIAGRLRLQTYRVIPGRSEELWHNDPLECTLKIPDDARLALRTRQPGDRFKPFGMQGKTQKLSDVFTNIKVPSYLRDRVPLLTINDEIAWFVAPTASGPVGRIAQSFAVDETEENPSILRLRWYIFEDSIGLNKKEAPQPE